MATYLKRRNGGYTALPLIAMGVALAASLATAEEARRLPATDAWGGVAPTAYNDEAEGDKDDEQEKTIEERLADLEKNYSTLEEKHEDLIGDYESLSGSLKDYVKTGHGKESMKLSGRIHMDMWNYPESSPGINEIETGDPNTDPADRIGFRRVRFGVAGDLPYNMLYKIEMEFAGGNDVEFRDVYLGWEELPIFRTLLFGNQKRPYGLDHLNSSRYNVFIERPFVIEGFNQDARRFGICSYGVSEDEAWNWRYGVYNQRLIQDEGNYISDNFQPQIAGRLANTIWYDECSDGRGYASWAVAGTWADTDPYAVEDNYAGSGINEARFRTRPEARTVSRWLDTGVFPNSNLNGEDYTLLGLEGVVNVGPVQWVGEYQNVWADRLVGDDINLHGGYTYLSYFLTGEYIPWDRESGTLDRVTPHENFFLVDRCRGGKGYGLGAWQVAVRYSYADFNDDNVYGGIGESVTAGLNWYWTPYARMQFNYIWGSIDNRDGNNTEDTVEPLNLLGGDYQAVGTRLMVDF